MEIAERYYDRKAGDSTGEKDKGARVILGRNQIGSFQGGGFSLYWAVVKGPIRYLREKSKMYKFNFV